MACWVSDKQQRILIFVGHWSWTGVRIQVFVGPGPHSGPISNWACLLPFREPFTGSFLDQILSLIDDQIHNSATEITGCLILELLSVCAESVNMESTEDDD